MIIDSNNQSFDDADKFCVVFRKHANNTYVKKGDYVELNVQNVISKIRESPAYQSLYTDADTTPSDFFMGDYTMKMNVDDVTYAAQIHELRESSSSISAVFKFDSYNCEIEFNADELYPIEVLITEAKPKSYPAAMLDSDIRLLYEDDVYIASDLSDDVKYAFNVIDSASAEHLSLINTYHITKYGVMLIVKPGDDAVGAAPLQTPADDQSNPVDDAISKYMLGNITESFRITPQELRNYTIDIIAETIDMAKSTVNLTDEQANEIIETSIIVHGGTQLSDYFTFIQRLENLNNEQYE